MFILFIDMPATLSQPFRNSFATPWHCAKQELPELALSAKERERQRRHGSGDAFFTQRQELQRSCDGVANDVYIYMNINQWIHTYTYIYIYIRKILCLVMIFDTF